MIKSKETESRYTPRKITITVSNVMIDENGMLYDEDGNIGDRLKKMIPDYVDCFAFKLSFEDDEGGNG